VLILQDAFVGFLSGARPFRLYQVFLVHSISYERSNVNLPSDSKQSQMENPEDLCTECAALDLPAAVRRANRHLDRHFRQISSGDGRKDSADESEGDERERSWHDYYEICRLGTRLATPSSCRLCSFFSGMRIPIEEKASDNHGREETYERNGDPISYVLLAFCRSVHYALDWKQIVSWRSLWESGRIQHDVLMVVAPELEYGYYNLDARNQGWLRHYLRKMGAIHLQSRPSTESVRERRPPIYEARSVTPLVNYSLLRDWISRCQVSHGSECFDNTDRMGLPRRLRVINCTSEPPKLEMQPASVRYLALSYVWGPASSVYNAWPQVVRDAAEVTKGLGLEFLWVDRLCIDQNDPVEKLELISKMDAIYECAECAIVAAAGSDPDYGLPAVGTFTRKSKPHVALADGSVLFSTVGDPVMQIEASVWSTRGWTYQEGVLSARRLVFTDEQVYFECREMNLCEGIELSEDILSNYGSGVVRPGMFQGKPEQQDKRDGLMGTTSLGSNWASLNTQSTMDKIDRFDNHVRNFSRRTLTYDADSLRAFEGIAQSFATRGSIGTIVGVPFLMMVKDELLRRASFAAGLSSWTHGVTLKPLLSGTSRLVRRRAHLPSWTWAGWEGEVIWGFSGRAHSTLQDRLHAKVPMYISFGDEVFLESRLYVTSLRLEAIPHDDRLEDGIPTLTAATLASISIAHPLTILNPFILAVTQLRLGEHESCFSSGDVSIHVSMSVETELAMLLADHQCGIVCSVLLLGFADDDLNTAMFLVCRKVPTSTGPPVFERIGRLAMTPVQSKGDGELEEEKLISRLPVVRYEHDIVLV
jgi:hypothetical protein